MLRIEKKWQNYCYLDSTYKTGETFLYNGHLYRVIDEKGIRRYLNMETARVETDFEFEHAKSVPNVQCTVSYEFVERKK